MNQGMLVAVINDREGWSVDEDLDLAKYVFTRTAMGQQFDLYRRLPLSRISEWMFSPLDVLEEVERVAHEELRVVVDRYVAERSPLPLYSSDREAEIDSMAWDAHLRESLEVKFDGSEAEWLRYAEILRNESRGYWHGGTGLIFDRNGLDDLDWRRFLSAQRVSEPGSLGDSVMDLSELLVLPWDDEDQSREKICHRNLWRGGP